MQHEQKRRWNNSISLFAEPRTKLFNFQPKCKHNLEINKVLYRDIYTLHCLFWISNYIDDCLYWIFVLFMCCNCKKLKRNLLHCRHTFPSCLHSAVHKNKVTAIHRKNDTRLLRVTVPRGKAPQRRLSTSTRCVLIYTNCCTTRGQSRRKRDLGGRGVDKKRVTQSA